MGVGRFIDKDEIMNRFLVISTDVDNRMKKRPTTETFYRVLNENSEKLNIKLDVNNKLLNEKISEIDKFYNT